MRYLLKQDSFYCSHRKGFFILCKMVLFLLQKSSAFKSEAPDILVQSQAVTTDDKIVENYSLSNGYSKGNDAGSFQFFEKLHQIAQDDSEPRSIREPVPEDFFTFIELIGQGNFGKVGKKKLNLTHSAD